MRRACLLAIAAIVVAVAAPADAAFPGSDGVIVFASDRGARPTLELYSVRPDGSAPTRLTTESPAGASPAWSPDGRQLAFVLERPYRECCSAELWVMRSDGTSLRHLVDAADPVPAVDWSPDSRRIAYTCRDRQDRRFLCVVDADGSGFRHLTSPKSGRSDYGARWSPDGRRLVFARRRGTRSDLYVINASSGRLTRLTKSKGVEESPAWSRTGEIAFVRDGDIYTMSARGRGLHNLTRSPHKHEETPDWSRDGRKIVFSDGSHLFVVAANGGRPVKIPLRRCDHPATPRWAPRGSRIALECFPGRVMVVDPSGGTAPSILLRAAADENPAVSPDGATVAFEVSRETVHVGVPPFKGANGVELVGIDGSNRRIAHDGANPSWSPDDRHVAVEASPEPGFPIKIVDTVTGTATTFVSDGRQPAWSPDGRSIAIVQSQERSNEAILVVDVATRRLRAETSPAIDESDLDPAWSPDSKKIAYTYTTYGVEDLYVMNADATGAHRLIADAASPVWSPSGTQIAFLRGEAIYVVNVDGSGLRRVADAPGPVLEPPDWQRLP